MVSHSMIIKGCDQCCGTMDIETALLYTAVVYWKLYNGVVIAEVL